MLDLNNIRRRLGGSLNFDHRVLNTTCSSSVVWNKLFGKGLDSSNKHSRDWVCFTYAAGTSWNNFPYGNYCRLEELVEICAVSRWCKGIVSGRLSDTASAKLGGSCGTTGPGVLVIAWTAARAALVAILFTDSWTLLATIDYIWANWASFSKGLSVFLWEVPLIENINIF